MKNKPNFVLCTRSDNVGLEYTNKQTGNNIELI